MSDYNHFFEKFGSLTRKSLDHPAIEDRECYSCKEKIEGRVKFIEWIPLFLRYVCICNNCHEKNNIGEFVDVIKKYEEYLGGICTCNEYMKEYYKYHSNEFEEFLLKIEKKEIRDYLRMWLKK